MIRSLLRGHFSPSKRAKRDYDRACQGILNTPPLDIQEAPLRFLSMMCHRDVIPYLVAIKSLYQAVGEGRIIIIDDGTLTPEDKALFTHHLGAPEIVPISEVETGPCPQGGTWERLLKILDFTADYYVIQVDADTVTTGLVDEVIRCYRENRSFTLGTPTGRHIIPVEEAARFTRDRVENETNPLHIQAAAEIVIDQVSDAKGRYYVRGSSGFAGFARGAISRADAEAFSKDMTRLVGDRWSEWGTEQITSNYLVANAPNSMVLPSPEYECFLRNTDCTDSVFIHFVGIIRYKDGVYKKASLDAINRLMR